MRFFQSHLVLLLVFSAAVSIAFALLFRDSQRERVRYAAMAFATFVLSALVVGWIMYPFPS